MASTQQSTLNDFFKTTKNARDGLSIKGGNKELSCTINNSVSGAISFKKVAETLSIPEVSLININNIRKDKPVKKTKGAASSSHNKLKSSTVKQESISSAFQRATNKCSTNSEQSDQVRFI